MKKKWGRFMYVHALLSVTVLLSCSMIQNRVTTQSTEALTFYQQGVKDYYNNYLQRAVQHFSKAIHIDSSFALAYCRLSITYQRLGDIASAKKNMIFAKKYSSSVTNKEKLFISICENKLQGNFQHRTVLLRRYFQKYPNDWECCLLLAEDCNRRHLYNQAEVYLMQLLKSDPENLPAHKLLVYTYLKFNQFDKAKKHIRQCLVIEPDEVDAIVTFGDIYRFSGDYIKAQQEYYRSIEFLPNFQRAHLQLGELYKETGQFEKTLQQLHLAYELLPSTLSNRSIEYARIAEVYLMMGRGDKAAQSAHRSLGFDDRNIKAIAVLGKVDLLENKITQARKKADEIKSIIEQENQNQFFLDVEFYDLLGEIANKEQDWNKAIESFYLAWQHSSEEFGIGYQIKIAENYLRVGNYQQAKHFCSQIIRRNPNLPLSHFILAQAHEFLNNYALAEMEYRKFVALSAGTNQYVSELKIAQKRILLVNRKNFAVNR